MADIDTIQFATPSIARRLIVFVYDALLVCGILVFTYLLPHTIIGAFLHRLAPPGVAFVHVFLVLLIYFVWFWLRGGQTLAMKTWRIRIISADGHPLRPAQALLRYMAAWLLLCFGISFIWALLDRDRQFLHDRIAGTRIVMA